MNNKERQPCHRQKHDAGGTFRCTDFYHGLHTISRVYPAGIYESHHHPHPGHHRSLMLGPKRGAALGFVFGLTSFINNTINPSVTSFVFTPFYSLGEYSGGFGSILICFLPRILVGVVPYYVYRLVTKIAGKWEKKGTAAGLALAGLSGSLTNTLLVMHMILLFFGHDYAMASEITGNVYLAILAVIGINGVPEAIVAAVIVMLIGKVLMNTKVMKNIGV